MDFIDSDELARIAKVNSSEWRRLHFRNNIENESDAKTRFDRKPENLSKRLGMYDSPAPLPMHQNIQTTVIQLCDTWFCDMNTFSGTIGPYVYSLQSYGK